MQSRKGLFLAVVLVLALIFSCGAVMAGDGALDPSFITGPGPYAGVQYIPEIRGQQAYPSVTGAPYNSYNLIFGTFWGLSLNNNPAPTTNCIARLKPDGSLDSAFNLYDPQTNKNQINGEIRGVFIYPHDDPNFPDKILIWGRFNTFLGSSQYSNLARLNADGSLDTSFPQAFTSWGGVVNSVAMQGTGTTAKLLVGGYNLNVQLGPDSQVTYQLIRLNYDGNLDGTYTHWGAPGGYIFGIRTNDPTIGTDVRIFCTYPKNQNGTGGTYYMLRLDSNAARPDITAPVASIGDELVDGPVLNLAKESGGKVIICGQFKKAFNGTAMVSQNRVARFTYDTTTKIWTLDISYDVGVGPNGVVTQISPVMANMATDPPSYDDRMVLSGSFTTWNGTPCGHLVRLSTTGAVDNFSSIGTGADDRIQRLNWKSDGTGGWIYGYFRSYSGQPRGGIAGLNGNGSLNSSFGNITANAGWPGMVNSLATQSDGKIIIGGDFTGVGGKYHIGLARINPNGSLDTSFNVGVDGVVNSVAVQADGKILLSGPFGQCNFVSCTSLARLNPDGTLDTTFKPMLVGGDNSLNNVYHVVPLSNGQIMIAGDIYNNTGSGPVARLNSDGSLDSAFFNNVSNINVPISGAQWLWGSRIALAGSNYVVAGGYDTSTGLGSGGYLGRLTNSGTLDTTFAPSASTANVQTMDGQVEDMLVQPDGKIVVSGTFSHIYGGSLNPARSAIARFSANGLLDDTFTPNLTLPSGANTIALAAMALQPNGKILIEENFLNVSGYNASYISSQVARLNPNGSLDPTFSLGTPAQGWFYPGGGNSILRLPNGKALIGGVFSSYNGTPAWSLVRIFAGPSNFSPGLVSLLLDN